LTEYLALLEKEAELSAKAKSAKDALESKLFAKYGKLSEEDIKSLVVEDKWLTTIEASIQGELDRVSQTLSGRVRELAERYAAPLPELVSEVEALSKRVEGHLKKMGFAS
jgi:type I restriction enzyme M protein